MKKLAGLFVIASLFVIPLFLLVLLGGRLTVSATGRKEIPEQNGTYNDPDHPGIKVRVFVHTAKPGKPPAPSPTLQCSLPDLNSDAVVDAAGWHLSPTFTYNLNVSSVPSSIGSNNLPTIAGDGFSAWTQATGNKINFVRGSDTTVNRQAYDGRNIVAWGRTSGTALAVTYIRYNSSGNVVDVDTIMNQNFRWMWSNQENCAYTNAYDAQDILTHEQGHWVGLDDEYASDYQDNTMYGYGATMEVKKDTLTAGDISGAASIY